MAQFPSFKPSGAGPIVDLKNIMVAQAMAWGAHKAKLVGAMTDVPGTSIHNGIEVYNYINLLGETHDFDNPTMKLMELYGVDDEGKQELNNAETENDLDQFSMIFKFGSVFSENGWKDYLQIISGLLEKATKFRITSSPISHIATGGYPLYINQFLANNTTSDNIYAHLALDTPEDPSWIIGVDHNSANITRLREHFLIQVFNGDTDITSDFRDVDQQAFLSMIIMEGALAFPVIIQEFVEEFRDGMYFMNQVEEWSTSININYMETRYEAYTLPNEGVNNNPNSFEDRVPGVSDTIYFPFYWANIWDSVRILGGSLQQGDTLFEETNGLFVAVGHHSLAYMTVEGLKTTNTDNFGFWVSQYMHINIHAEQPTGLKAIIVGIMQAFLTLIDAAVGLFLKIPILKQTTEIILSVIGKMFGVDAEASRDILNKIIMTVIIIVISYFTAGAATAAIGVTGTTATIGTTIGMSAGLAAGLSTVVTYTSYALQIYRAAIDAAKIEQDKEFAKDEAEFEYRQAKANVATNPGAIALEGTMGTLEQHEMGDMLMYTIMFNPFDYHPQAIPADELPSGILK